FLDQLLAKPRKVAPIKNMTSVPYSELPGVMATLVAEETVASAALRFVILTACRLGQALGARWEEIDLEAAEGGSPKERMKADTKEHRVPLSPQALGVLKSLPTEQGNPFLFISSKTPRTSITDTTVTAVLRRAGRGETIHGMRSAFSTWAHERSR